MVIPDRVADNPVGRAGNRAHRARFGAPGHVDEVAGVDDARRRAPELQDLERRLADGGDLLRDGQRDPEGARSPAVAMDELVQNAAVPAAERELDDPPGRATDLDRSWQSRLLQPRDPELGR